MAAALPFAVSGLGSLLGGIGASKGSKATSDTTSTTNQKSSSTQEGVLQGKQNKVNKLIGQNLIDWLRLGPNVSQGDRDTMRGQINDQADAATDRVSSDLASRGMSNSGVKGRSFKDIQLARTKAFQTGEAGLQSQALQRFMQAMGIGLQYDQPRQFTSSGESSGTTHQTGTQTQSGQSPFSTIGSGLGDLSSFMFMKNMFPGAGGGGGGYQWAGNEDLYGCWIARAVYGQNDWRVLLVRAFLVRKAAESRSWAILWALYLAFGKAIAPVVQKSKFLKLGFRSLFDRIVFAA